MLRASAIALLSVAIGCAPVAEPVHARRGPLDGYASAVEEAVFRYECEADRAVRDARRLPPHRYERLLARALAARGLSMEGLRALDRTAPRFYGTELARYVIRLDDAELRAAAGVTASAREGAR